MNEFFADYGLFLLKTLTFVFAFIAIIAAAAAAGRKASQQEGLEVENLNQQYRKLASGLRRAVMSKSDWKAEAKKEKERAKAESKSASDKPRVFVVDFKGDLKATAVPSLREEVSAILEVAREGDEVVLRLDNHGGVVHEHGLAASQLVRLRNRGIRLTAVVDKVASRHAELPCMIAIAIRQDENPEIREEDYASAFMGIQNLSLAADAAGWGSHIKTGAVMDDPRARAAVGLAEDERVVAVLEIGEPAARPDAPERPSASALTTWVP